MAYLIGYRDGLKAAAKCAEDFGTPYIGHKRNESAEFSGFKDGIVFAVKDVARLILALPIPPFPQQVADPGAVVTEVTEAELVATLKSAYAANSPGNKDDFLAMAQSLKRAFKGRVL